MSYVYKDICHEFGMEESRVSMQLKHTSMVKCLEFLKIFGNVLLEINRIIKIC